MEQNADDRILVC